MCKIATLHHESAKYAPLLSCHGPVSLATEPLGTDHIDAIADRFLAMLRMANLAEMSPCSASQFVRQLMEMPPGTNQIELI